MKPESTDEVFQKFLQLEGVIYRQAYEGSNRRFLYRRGSRENKVVLIAHADTIYQGYPDLHTSYDDISRSYNPWAGADDRAGCAIVWLLRNLGHSLLIVDGEEAGLEGAFWLMEKNKDIADEINNHQFLLEFDRAGWRNFKTYFVGSTEFINYINESTGYHLASPFSFTDIITLCRNVCGANISVGYLNEHTEHEYVDTSFWLETLRIVKRWLSAPYIPKFPLGKPDGELVIHYI